MGKCNECGREFDEPKKITAEAFYDCSFDYNCGYYIYMCPYCDSTDFEYDGYFDDEDEEELMDYE